jgi:hypothetical protein
VARVAPTLVVLALLAGTAVAFGVTERLKLERSPIAAPEIDKAFSPVCACESDEAEIAFRMRRRDTISLAIVDADGELVRRLVDHERADAGPFRTSWDGRDDAGELVPQGVYRPRLRLARGRRTIVLPNPIRVDTTPPRIRLVSAAPDAFSPDGDDRNDRVTVSYTVNEKAHALLYVDGALRVRTRFRPLEGEIPWFGIVGRRPLRAGRHRLELAAEDLAGNVSERTQAVDVTIRYIAVARSQVRARARTRFGVRVTTDARTFHWRFAGGRGVARPGLLVLRAPRRAGRYTLFVSANRHGARASVQVFRRAARLPR